MLSLFNDMGRVQDVLVQVTDAMQIILIRDFVGNFILRHHFQR